MKYRDAEIYLNNPTLSPENQGDYQNESIFQLGLLTSLPPAAMWIIQRARAADKRRNALYRIRNYERNVRRGTHFSRNPRAQSTINETKINEEFYNYAKELEELRAEESSVDADHEDIARRREELERRIRTLVQDINEKPYTVYVSKDDRKVAQYREMYTRDQEWEWLRSAESGESFAESVRRLEAAKIIAEQRHIVDSMKSRLEVKDLTSSGQKAFRILAKFLKNSFGVNIDNIDSNPREFENIKVYKGSPGMYRYEITLPSGYGNAKFEVELPAFYGDDMIRKQIELAGFSENRFDGKLFSSFIAHNTFRIDGQTRVSKVKYRVEGKKNILILPSQTVFGEGGRFDGTIRALTAQVQRLQRVPGKKDNLSLINTIVSTIRNLQFDEEAFEVIEKSHEQELFPGSVILERPKLMAEDPEKAALMDYIKQKGISDLGKRGSKSVKDIIRELNLKYLSSITENPMYLLIDGRELELYDIESRTTLAGSTGAAESAKTVAVPSGVAFAGGHAQGQQALRTNLALGFNINSAVKRAIHTGARVSYYEERKIMADRLRKIRMRLSSAKSRAESMETDQETRFNPRFQSIKRGKERIKKILAKYRMVPGLERYDIANQKWKTTTKGSFMEGEEASFRVRRVLITIGDELSGVLGVERDQSITIGRYGVKFSEIYNNPNVDLIQVSNSIAYIADHTVTFNKASEEAVSRRVRRGREDSIKYISGRESKSGSRIFKSITRKLKEAEKNRSPMILVTREEAQALDIPVSENMRVEKLRGSSVELQTPHYVVLFEKRYTGDSNIVQYRFAGDYNTKNILGEVTKESSKTTNKIMAPQGARELVEHVFSQRVSSDPEVRIARAAAEAIERNHIHQVSSGDFLIGKGYNLQLNEGIFRRILSQLAENELSDAKNLSQYVKYSMKGQIGYLDSRQAVININGQMAKGSSFYEAAEDLFAKIILGRDRRPGERFISSLGISRVKSSGETTVSFKLTANALENWRHTKATVKFLEMIRDKNIEAMKKVNEDINAILLQRNLGSSKNKDLFFGYIDDQSPGKTYVTKVVNMVAGDKVNSSKSMFLDIMFGQGVAQGHDFYPKHSKPVYGNNFYEGGAIFNAIEITGMRNINRAMSSYLSSLMSMNIERNYLSRMAALSFNKSINMATRENQNEDARRLIEASRKVYKDSLSVLDEVTYMTKDAFVTGETAVDTALKSERIKKRRVGDFTVTEVLEKYRKIDAGLDIGSKAEALIRALGIDNFYIDQEDETRLRIFYKARERTMQEVIPGSGLKITGIPLLEPIRLNLFQEDYVGNPKTNMLYVSIPKPGEIGEKVDVLDIIKLGQGLLGETKEKTQAKQIELLKLLQRDGVINVKKMNGGSLKHLQIEILNKLSRMIKNAGSTSSEANKAELRELLEILSTSIERIANNMIEEEARQVGFGKKSQEIYKINPGYSANLNLSRYDDIKSAWSKIAEQRGFPGQELEWNAVVINKEQATAMANSKMVSASRALFLVSNFSSNKIGKAILEAELQDISKELGFVDLDKSPLGALAKNFEGIYDTEREVRKGKYSRSARRVNAQLGRILRTIGNFQDLGFNSWESINKATQNKSAVGVQAIRKLFSKEGFYKKISTHIYSGKYKADVFNAWKHINNAIQEIGMLKRNKTKGMDIGRLYSNWKSIGERLNEKNTWSLIDSALQDAIDNASGEDAENIKLLKRVLQSAAEEQKEFKAREQKVIESRKGSGPASISRGIANLYKEFEERFGKNFHVLELIERAGIDANSLNSYIKENKAAPGQLGKFNEVLQKKKTKIAKDFIGFELLANRLQSLISFNNEEELLRLQGMSDEEIRKLAKNKTRSLIKLSIELANQIKNSSVNEKLKYEFRKRIIEFQREIKGVRGERGLVEELTEAFKFFKGILGEGVTGIQGVDPNIAASKHMKQVIIRSVLSTELTKLQKGGIIDNAEYLISYIKQASMKVGALFQSVLDRDFDGDRGKLVANIIDRRWGSPKESIVTSNVLGFMSDSSFSYSDGRLKAANVYSARNIELLTNEKFKAKEIVLEKIEDYVRKAVKRELAVHGEMEFKPGESLTAYLDRKQKEVLDAWLMDNHGKNIEGKEREKILSETYILTKADTITSSKVEGQKDSLVVKLLGGKKEESTLTSRQVLKGAYVEGYVIDLLNRLGGGVKDRSEETYLNRNYNLFRGKDLRDSALETLKRVPEASFELVEGGAKTLLDEVTRIRGLDAKVFMTQKSVTGELYKYPMMMRAFGAALAENNIGKLGQMGRAMSEVASFAGYMFEQHIAIGIKKGGQDAGEGVKNLYQRISTIASVEDDVKRESLIKNLYNELTTKGLETTPTVREAIQIERSGFAEKMLGKGGKKSFGSLELLRFGQAKQMAVEDLLEGKRSRKSDRVVNFLMETFGDKVTKEDAVSVSRKLKLEVVKEAKETMRKANEEGERAGKGSATVTPRGTLAYMLDHISKLNSDTAAMNQTYLNFSKFGITSSVNLMKAAKESGLIVEYRKMTSLLGSVSKDAGERDFIMDLVAKMDKEGISKSSFGRAFIEEIANSNVLSKMDLEYIKSVIRGKKGKETRIGVTRKVHELFSKNAYRNAAIAALGVLAVGTFAPDVTVGAGRDSYIDKRPEIESELPRKMIAQYNNQANVSYVPPWVSERIRAERREKAVYNSMFFQSLIG